MKVSRRGLLGSGAAAAGVVGAYAVGHEAAGGPGTPTAATPGDAVASSYPFRGEHQAGIVTPAQDRLHFAAFDVRTDSREELVALLKAWTEAAERMTRGEGAGPIGPTQGAADLPPDDTGEAIGLPPARADDHLRLRARRCSSTTTATTASASRSAGPRRCEDLPHFPADILDPARSGGDLCIQACAQDPQVAVHAIRNLARIGFGTVAVRWSQLGFGRTSTTSTSQSTPRNLFGFKDGTANVKAEETDALDDFVWVQDGDDAGPTGSPAAPTSWPGGST